jgi:hypothetical protein
MTKCDRDKSDPVARDGDKESQRAHHKGGPPGPLNGDRRRRARDPSRSAPPCADFSVYVTRPAPRRGTGRRTWPASSPIPLRDLTARDRTSNCRP